jgi:hypothetical protein
MAHIGVLQSTFTFTPVRTGDTVTSITVACTMYSAPLVETMESRTVDGKTSDYGVTVTDEANKVTLGSDSITWSVPSEHQAVTEFNIVDETDGDNILMEDGNTLIADIRYIVNWKHISDRSEDKQSKLIKESTDFQNMMNTLWALQSTYND